MRSVLFTLGICISFFTQAQYKLVFTNAGTNKTITVKHKDLARIGYNGYMNQPQQAEGIVTAITDSSITLSPRKKFLQKKQAAQTIFIHDITGFRKYSKFRPAAEIIYAVAGVGITGTVAAIIGNASVPTVVTFFSAAGTAAVTTGLKNVFFSSKIKNKLSKGWTMQLLQDQLPAANLN